MGGMPYGMGVPYGPAYFPMPYGQGYPGPGAYAGQEEEEDGLGHFSHGNEDHSQHSHNQHYSESQPSKHRKQGGSSKRRHANASGGSASGGSASARGEGEGENGVSIMGLKNDAEGHGLVEGPEQAQGMVAGVVANDGIVKEVERQDNGADKGQG